MTFIAMLTRPGPFLPRIQRFEEADLDAAKRHAVTLRDIGECVHDVVEETEWERRKASPV